MRIVITGSRGFVGSHMVPFFHARGAEVIGVDLPQEGSRDRDHGTGFIAADIREIHCYRAALFGADAIIHMASAHLQVGLPRSEYWSINVHSLPALLEAAEAAGVKHFIHTSSVGVHGSLNAVPGNEDSPVAPENTYDETKAAGELQVRHFLQARGKMGVTILRPAWIYGLGDARTERLLRAVRKGRFVFFGNGSNHRHPIYICDYLTAVSRIVGQPQTFGSTYILAGPRYLTARHLVQAVERVTGGIVRFRVPLWVGHLAGHLAELLFHPLPVSPPLSRRTMAFFKNENAFDTTRARSDFGFDPKVDVDEGLSTVWTAMPARN